MLTVGAGRSPPPATLALDPETGAGIPYGAYSYATQLVEVAVDDEDGRVPGGEGDAAHDWGRSSIPWGRGPDGGRLVMGLGTA